MRRGWKGTGLKREVEVAPHLLAEEGHQRIAAAVDNLQEAHNFRLREHRGLWVAQGSQPLQRKGSEEPQQQEKERKGLQRQQQQELHRRLARHRVEHKRLAWQLWLPQRKSSAVGMLLAEGGACLGLLW